LSELNIEAQVVMTGYVSDEELIWLYRNCYANLYPSLFEGFGLPVLEGMQFGAPTLTSNTTSIPEVAGNAAILLDPEDISAWTQSMLSLAADRLERDRLSLAAREQASSFDWNFSTVALLKIYEEALASKKRCVLS
jgi:glycosyltransferase involved in cell wall biosynthesis